MRNWHVVPLVIAVAMMVSSRFVLPFSRAAHFLLFGGLLLTMGALPLALPVGAARLGARLGRSGHPPRWLAGRRLSLRAATLSRPAAAVGLLVFIAGGAFALYGRMVEPDTDSLSDAPLSRFTVDWRDSQAGDIDYLTARLGDMHVIPVATPVADDPPDIGAGAGVDEPSRPMAIFTGCRHLESAVSSLPLTPCAPDGTITETFIQQFQALTQLTPVLQTDPHPPADPYQVLLLAEDQSVTPGDLMRALAPRLPAVNISKEGPYTTSDSGVGWLVLGWIAALLILSAALLREVGDRALAALEEDVLLFRLGLSRSEIDSVQRWTLLPPVAIAIPVGYVGAVAFAVFGFYLGFTVNYIARITLVAAIVGFMAAGSLALAFSVHRRSTEQARAGASEE